MGREWIHGVGVVPSTMHQRLTLWKEDGVLKNIEADQSYFLAEVATVTKNTFDKQLAKIAPCAASGFGYEDQYNFLWSMKLHLKDGFTWKKKLLMKEAYSEPGLLLTQRLQFGDAQEFQQLGGKTMMINHVQAQHLG